MPLNESSGSMPGSLTDKQQREAMSAIYGLTERDTMSPETLTYEERVKMRRYLDQMDQKEASGAMKEFDLNKPPVQPYVYREFPFLMYHHQNRTTKPARNHEERERLVAEGWSETAFPSEPPELPLTAAEHAEAEEINRKLSKKGDRK